jgi:hypothetical protein
MTPKLEIVTTRVSAIAPEVHTIELVVQNAGYLPTYVSKNALKRKLTRGVIGEISGAVSLIEGKSREQGPQLEGRAHVGSLQSFFPLGSVTPDRHVFRWVVKGAAGTVVRLTARHERAGTLITEVKLGQKPG